VRYELNRIEPFTLAKNAAVFYGVLSTALAILISPFLLLTAMMGGGGESSGAAAIFSVFFLIAYPFIGVIMGWVMGWGAAVVFNLAAPRIGGVRLEMAEAHAASPMAPAVSSMGPVAT
jgi:hypothetical protein